MSTPVLLILDGAYTLSSNGCVIWVLNAQICRETGKEHMVQVHSGEGLANHPGPEPCGGLREGTDEKSVGEHVGGLLRRESC